MNSLVEFLNRYKVTNKEKYTHASMPTETLRGKWLIPDENLNEFYTLMQNAIESGYTPSITEKRDNQTSPIVIDLDLRFVIQEGKEGHYYEPVFLEAVINKYVDTINYYLDIKSEKVIPIVFERDPIIDKNVVKEGIHIIFPFVVTEYNFQFFLRSKIIEYFESSTGLLTGLKDTDWDKIFDYSVVKNNNWFLYNNCKPNRQPYRITRNEDHLPQSQIDRFDFFSVRNKPVTGVVKSKCTDVYNKWRKRYEHENDIIDDENGEVVQDEIDAEKFLFIEDLVMNCINPERANSHNDWAYMGWVLANIEKSTRMEMLFHRFTAQITRQDSSRYPFDQSKNHEFWFKIKIKKHSPKIGSLIYLCREDNAEQYEVIEEKHKYESARKHMNRSDLYSIARVVHIYASRMFRFEHDDWYYFNADLKAGPIKWVRLGKNPVPLHIFLNEVIFHVYWKYYEELVKSEREERQALEVIEEEARLAREREDPNYKPPKKEEKKGASALVKETAQSLRNVKAPLVKEIANSFWKLDPFKDKLDQYPHLFAFNNGVYDLREKRFRETLPEDMISKTCGYDYTPERNVFLENEVKIFLQELFNKNEDVYNYQMRFLASCLEGNSTNMGEVFHLWTGIGNNGKSVFTNFLQLVFGEYCTCPAPTLFTKPRTSSQAPSADIQALAGTRLALSSETERGDKIHSGILKSLTGGDVQSSRALFSNHYNLIRMLCKFVMITNTCPQLSDFTYGMARRMRRLPWNVRFVENPKHENEYPLDDTISENFEKWKMAFIHLLIDEFNHMKTLTRKEKRKIPNIILEATAEWLNRDNFYAEFKRDKVVEERARVPIEHAVRVNDLYEQFQAEFRAAFPSEKVPARNVFTEEMKAMLFNPSVRDGVWPYLRYAESTIEEPLQLI